MAAEELERQRVKMLSQENSKFTFAHHLSLQEAAFTRSQHRNHR